MLISLGGVVVFFFFFFDNLYFIQDIQQAFKKVCLNKILSDGYFDMSKFIYARIRKDDMLAKLTSRKPKFAELYKNSIPKKDDAYSVWIRLFGEQYYIYDSQNELSYDESVAIVNWVYRTMQNSDEREEFTKQLFERIKDFYSIKHNVKFIRGVVYNEEKVEIHFLSSVSSVSRFISSLQLYEDESLFFRGHSDANFILLPSIMRTQKLCTHEHNLYNELQIECPDEFEKCKTHLEKLVKMQHYGLPTRLLDITKNLLVALYFSCEGNKSSFGELVLISEKINEIKYPLNDTVSITASLCSLTHKRQQEIFELAKDGDVSELEFNNRIIDLIHEIQLEKPAFTPNIRKNDVLNNCIVYALKNNNRIIKQDGAFILCGLSAESGSLENYRYKSNGKRVIALIDKKKTILEELQTFSINRSTLFPEIESVSCFLKEKYSL